MKSFKKYFSFGLVLVFLFTFLPTAFTRAQAVEKDMLLVFDASGSMSELFGGSPRIDVLKSSVSDLLNTLDSSVFVGLRPFANIKNADQVQACKITSLAQNFTTERSIIKTQTSLLQAVGSYTPLAYTITVSGGDFKVGNDNVLILLTDGKDTCNGDPVKAAGDLFNSDKKVKIYVIGMGVDADTKAQLSAISTAGGGVYYDASDSASLASSFKAIQALEKPIDRTNTDALLGTPIRGGTGFDNALLVNPGEYRLDHNLAPDQYDYFKISVKRGDVINFGVVTTDKTVYYDKETNSFTESRTSYYSWPRIEAFNSNRVSISWASMRNANSKDIVKITAKEDGFIFFKIGNDYVTDKYSRFVIKVIEESTNNLLGTPVRGGTNFDNATSITSGVYRLDYDLAPYEYEYFKLNVKKGDSVYFKGYVGDEVGGNSTMRFDILDSDRVNITDIYLYGKNEKMEKTIKIEQDGNIFIKIGSSSVVNKYNTFTISVNGETNSAVKATITQNNAGDSSIDNSNNNSENNIDSNKASSNNLIYILFGIIVALIIIIGIVLFIFLKKKNNPSNNIPPTTNFPPTNNIPPAPSI